MNSTTQVSLFGEAPRRPQPTDDIDICRYVRTPCCVYYDGERHNGHVCMNGHSVNYDLEPRVTKRDVVRQLRKDGWRFMGGVWVCPDCVAALHSTREV